MTTAPTVRELLASGCMVRVPGVYDGITGRVAEQAGLDCL